MKTKIGKKDTKNVTPATPEKSDEPELQRGVMFKGSMSKKGISLQSQVVTPCGVMSYGMALDWDHDK